MSERAISILSFDPLQLPGAPVACLKVVVCLPVDPSADDPTGATELPTTDIVILLREPATPREIADMIASAVDRWHAIWQVTQCFQEMKNDE